LDVAIADLERKRDVQTGGVLNQLEAELVEKQKADTKATSALTHKQESLRSEQKKLKELQKQQGADGAHADAKRKELDKLCAMFDKLQALSQTDREAQAAAQKHLQVRGRYIYRYIYRYVQVGWMILYCKDEIMNRH